MLNSRAKAPKGKVRKKPKVKSKGKLVTVKAAALVPAVSIPILSDVVAPTATPLATVASESIVSATATSEPKTLETVTSQATSSSASTESSPPPISKWEAIKAFYIRNKISVALRGTKATGSAFSVINKFFSSAISPGAIATSSVFGAVYGAAQAFRKWNKDARKTLKEKDRLENQAKVKNKREKVEKRIKDFEEEKASANALVTHFPTKQQNEDEVNRRVEEREKFLSAEIRHLIATRAEEAKKGREKARQFRLGKEEKQLTNDVIVSIPESEWNEQEREAAKGELQSIKDWKLEDLKNDNTASFNSISDKIKFGAEVAIDAGFSGAEVAVIVNVPFAYATAAGAAGGAALNGLFIGTPIVFGLAWGAYTAKKKYDDLLVSRVLDKEDKQHKDDIIFLDKIDSEIAVDYQKVSGVRSRVTKTMKSETSKGGIFAASSKSVGPNPSIPRPAA